MTAKLLSLFHIEISVPDAERAYQILHNVFGAEKVQDDFVGFLDGDYNKVIHVGLGDVVLQFIEPKVEESSWYYQLKTKGAGIHNLNFSVESAKETAEEMERLGGMKPLFTFDLPYDQWHPAEILRPGMTKVYMMNTMEKLGFHLEFGENPFKEDYIDETPQTLYITGRDELVGAVSPMLHIELVTHDLEKTYELLHKVFGSEKVEIEFANFLDDPSFMRTLHVNLGNVVLQYQQPLIKIENFPMGSWYNLLEKNGPYVHNLTFIVNNLDDVVEKFKKEGIEPLFTFPLQWEKLNENIKSEIKPVHMMNTIDQLGFHMEFGEIPLKEERKAFSDLLYIDLNQK